jgi:Uma2 family endonuclease
MAATEKRPPLTIDEYLRIDDSPFPTELVRGEIVVGSFHGFQHGVVCVRIACLLTDFVKSRRLGHVVTRVGVVTTRDPDTVPGADVAFYSHARIPDRKMPDGYPTQPPETIFEVRDRTEAWGDLEARAGEYLRAGVIAVCVADPETKTAVVHEGQGAAATLSANDVLRLPAPLQRFSAPVLRLFE